MRRSTKNAWCALGLSACSSLVACGESEETRATPPLDSDQGAFTRTVVVLGPDGHEVVQTEVVTAHDMEEMKRSRESKFARTRASDLGAVPADHLAVLSRGDCNDDRAMWFFDAPGQAGNQLCLIRNGGVMDAVGLVNLKHPGFRQHWGGRVRSFWAGADPGYFRIDQEPFLAETFTAFRRTDSVSTTVRDAYAVALTENNATLSIPVVGYEFNRTSCPPARIGILEGSTFFLVQVEGFVVDLSRGPTCKYATSWNFKWGVNYQISHVGGSCDLRLLEWSLLNPPGNWWLSLEAHHYDNGCFQVPPQ
jgi:hypothetical protein